MVSVEDMLKLLCHTTLLGDSLISDPVWALKLQESQGLRDSETPYSEADGC